MWIRSWAMLNLVALTIGCAERTVIRSTPSGASVILNDEMIGRTPATYEVGRFDWPGSFAYRIEAEGYHPEEGELDQVVFGGRIAGAIFTLGIVALCRRMVGIRPRYEFALEPMRASEIRSDIGSSQPASTDERLERLSDLRERGLVTTEEYEAQKARILGGL